MAVSDDGQAIWAADGAGVIRRSLDAGATWATRSDGSTNVVGGIELLDGGAVLVMHGRTATVDSEVRRSVDDGATWNVAFNSSSSLKDMTTAEGQVAWIVGEGGLVARSLDRGITFSSTTSGAGARPASPTLYAVSAVDAQSAVVAGVGEAIMNLSPGISVPDFNAATAPFSAPAGAFGACPQAPEPPPTCGAVPGRATSPCPPDGTPSAPTPRTPPPPWHARRFPGSAPSTCALA